MATQSPAQPDGTAPQVEPPTTTSAPPIRRTPRSRAGAVWVGSCVSVIVLIALVVFMLQNTQQVQVTFLAMQGTVPLAIALLIAGVGVGILALTIGTIRIGQLRHRLAYERHN